MQIALDPIGIIHTPFSQVEGTPIQSSRSTIKGIVEVFPQYQEGLDGIEGFSHIILLYYFHLSEHTNTLKVKPFLDNKLHGVFTTRYPQRPNLIGLSIVELVTCSGNQLEFLGADMLDGTPLLDIKPYIPDFDLRTASKIGWYQFRSNS